MTLPRASEGEGADRKPDPPGGKDPGLLLQITDRCRQVLMEKSRSAPIARLLRDDVFCGLMMRHRQAQGLVLPSQNPSVDFSGRLSFLHALAGEGDIAEARERCDQSIKMRDTFKSMKEIKDVSLRKTLADAVWNLFERGVEHSHWAAQYLLYGEDRIPQAAIPLHDQATDTEQAVGIITGLMTRRMSRSMTISDRDPDTRALSFIRIGRDPVHFAFPETAGHQSAAPPAILEYEIDHPGGDFVFFSSIEIGSGRLLDFMERAQRDNPLYINDLDQMMALNSYYLQAIGAFCVPAGDSSVTLLMRDGVMTASEAPDYAAEADQILQELSSRGVTGADLAAMAPFLRQGEIEEESGWDIIERLRPAHPDLLGYDQMQMDRSYIFGAPETALHALALKLNGGDEVLADADVAEATDSAQRVCLPAGRYHLYVPNLASKAGYEPGLAALERASGRGHEGLWFVLADRTLDLGADPSLVGCMRRLGADLPSPPDDLPNP